MQDLRQEYDKNELLESLLDKDPLVQFQHWFDQALNEGVIEPNAMTLSTISEHGADSRIVLLKGVEDGNFVFYTNYNSHKSQQLLRDGRCSLLFLWLHQQRQVIVRGTAQKNSSTESDAYFASRPRGSQIGAWVSDQSKPILNREKLEERLQELTAYFEGKAVNRPEHWGGYSVEPKQIEFWQGRPNRLHDRILYSKENGSWSIQRLQP